jgi:regulator of protease activity HflC (stomatin/prohibitin superfamily)
MNIALALRGISTLSWVVALAIIVLAVARAARGQRLRGAAGLVIGAIIIALLLTTVSSGLVFIQPTERGVVISAIQGGGVRQSALGAGLNWIVPFFENVLAYPISNQTYTMSIAPTEGQIAGDDSVEARTADGQQVRVDASVIFSIDPSKVVEAHIKWEGQYVDRLIRPVARGIIRDAVSQFAIEEVYSSERATLIQRIENVLDEQLADGGLIMQTFVLRNIAFTDEYSASIEQKQIQEQKVLQAAFVVQEREQEAEQVRIAAQGQADAAVTAAEGRAEARIIEAKAEAEALQLIAEALRDNPEVLTFEYITRLSPYLQQRVNNQGLSTID